jgi:predicted transglutaminase-like cysteine proteinase
MILELEIAFHSMEYSDSFEIEKIKVDLCDEDKENILKANQLMKDNKFIENIRVSVNSKVTFVNDEDNDITEKWKCDAMQYIVYNDIFFFYAQNKWHAGDQIESPSIPINQLN